VLKFKSKPVKTSVADSSQDAKPMPPRANLPAGVDSMSTRWITPPRDGKRTSAKPLESPSIGAVRTKACLGKSTKPSRLLSKKKPKPSPRNM